MRYIPHTENDIRAMLDRIGIDGVGDLFTSIPEPLRLTEPLRLPEALAESDLTAAMKDLARQNMSAEDCASFLGAGSYRHFTPSLVNHMILRGEFATCYTPYQPEVSQGTLQAVFEFQTFISLLTGMGIANASMYDGATALAEAVLMAHRVAGGNEVVMSDAVHPEYRQVVETYLHGSDVNIIRVPWNSNGQSDLVAMQNKVTDSTCAVVVQSPNFFGVVEEFEGLGEFLNEKKTLLVAAVAEPTSLGILKPPGERGADIVAGEGQGFGLPVSFGGPYVGFFSTHDRYLRQIPGRIVGETVDREGRRAFSLTIKTREQDIRREKATSNICTNQGLCALAVTIWLSAMGKKGLREIAVENVKRSDLLKRKLAGLKNFKLKFDAPTYNEFVLECPGPAEEIQARLLEEKIIAGLPLGTHHEELGNCLLLCTTELTSEDDMERLVNALNVI
ncbi:MAG: aminomethyl-transferring glycine dehydrogenase subunit GcvPA [Candidatus Nitronauta litoralis]|uniref:Probable glycine dehydrogenase (decarboxylating) subunit 1 n=1 Tax=Candidatus Nitronauta litoralis TaxID=2705533 RepID=A0A7T0BWD8_9BACT|nr:MAG: aminomethyl-transferring glycine dehydrogenase subunit GcvPA [Candidatus Nitronauta litoralis]